MGAPITDLRDLDFDKPLDDRLSALQRKLVRLCNESVPYWAKSQLLGEGKGQQSPYSATVKVVERGVDLRLLADKPQELVDFTLGDMDGEGRRYAANAVRKAMAVARTGLDTSKLREIGEGAFQNIVKSVNDDGSWSVGEFPWAGAVLIELYGYRVVVAVSGYDQWKDDAVARAIAGFAAVFLKEYDDAAAKARASTEEAAADQVPVPGAVG